MIKKRGGNAMSNTIDEYAADVAERHFGETQHNDI